jgi:hypothetical protein
LPDDRRGLGYDVRTADPPERERILAAFDRRSP